MMYRHEILTFFLDGEFNNFTKKKKKIRIQIAQSDFRIKMMIDFDSVNNEGY